jgi:hypothetical protein
VRFPNRLAQAVADNIETNVKEALNGCSNRGRDGPDRLRAEEQDALTR